MLTRVLTLRFNELIDAFDDASLRDFIKDVEVVSMRDHFFTRDDRPYLAMVVQYKLRGPAEAVVERRAEKRSKRREESWRDFVPEADHPMFNALRDWRLARAKQEGLPIYLVCNNRELGAVAAARPRTMAQLAEIEGIGKAKIERYGTDILAVVARGQADAQPASEAGEKSDGE